MDLHSPTWWIPAQICLPQTRNKSLKSPNCRQTLQTNRVTYSLIHRCDNNMNVHYGRQRSPSMGSTALTHVQFSSPPQTYFRRPIFSSHHLVFQDHNFLNVSLSKLCIRTYVSHEPTVRIFPTEF